MIGTDSIRYSVTYSHDDLLLTDRLQRIHRLLYNNSKPSTADIGKKVTNPYKHLSVPVLFKRQYSKQIIERRDEILASGDADTPLRAYNLAANDMIQELEERAPERYASLVEEVEVLRRASGAPFEAHSEEVQTRSVICQLGYSMI